MENIESFRNKDKVETDRVYTPQDNDYSRVYENFEKYDGILNVRK